MKTKTKLVILFIVITGIAIAQILTGCTGAKYAKYGCPSVNSNGNVPGKFKS